MRTTHKLLLTTLTTALLLASAITTASARNLSTSNINFRVTWRELDFGGGLVRCELTLEGSFHYRTIVKRERALIGLVTRATIRRPCAAGEVWADNGIEVVLEGTERARLSNASLPWHLTYEGFTGTLPNITSTEFLLRNLSFVVSTSGLCLARYGKTEDNLTASIARNISTAESTTLTPVAEKNRTSRREVISGAFCPLAGALTGEGNVTLLGNTTRIRLILI